MELKKLNESTKERDKTTRPETAFQKSCEPKNERQTKNGKKTPKNKVSAKMNETKRMKKE